MERNQLWPFFLYGLNILSTTEILDHFLEIQSPRSKIFSILHIKYLEIVKLEKYLKDYMLFSETVSDDR